MRRRYSDFYSLRDTLVRLHPTLIIPPIPEKHSMADYAAKPTKAKEDEAIIDHRKRMLSSFLNRCRRLQDVREDGVFWKFLEPNATWVSTLVEELRFMLTSGCRALFYKRHLSQTSLRTTSKLHHLILRIRHPATTIYPYPLQLPN